MRVAVFPTAFDAMGFNRLIWPAQACMLAGHKVKVLYPDDPNRLPYTADIKGNLVDVATPDADIVVLQRVTQPMLLQIIRIWQSRGLRVVIDMDDDLRAVTPHTNPGAFKLMHVQHHVDGADPDDPAARIDWQTTEDACKTADVVTTSSDALYKRYSPDSMFRRMLPNMVPSRYFSLEPKPEAGVIGWAGATAFRYSDPEQTGAAIARLQRDGFEFAVVGPPKDVETAWRLDRPPLRTGAVNLFEYPDALQRFAVGISPLVDTAFNRSKSWLKMIEYAALGVPCVVSPMPEYRKLHARGVGVLAHNPREWYQKLRLLLTDDARREDLAAQGRDAVAGFTYESRADDWWNAWTLGA